MLESARGFLIHVVGSTYNQLNPFLNGVHLTLDSWRANRKEDGRKMTPKEWEGYLETIEEPKVREKIQILTPLATQKECLGSPD